MSSQMKVTSPSSNPSRSFSRYDSLSAEHDTRTGHSDDASPFTSCSLALIFFSQGCRSRSSSGTPDAIFAMFSGG